jgi:hypothetical protein
MREFAIDTTMLTNKLYVSKCKRNVFKDNRIGFSFSPFDRQNGESES